MHAQFHYWPMFPETWFRHTKASWQWLDHVLQLSNLQSFPESIIGAFAFWIQIKAAKKTITGVLLLQLQFIQSSAKEHFGIVYVTWLPLDRLCR